MADLREALRATLASPTGWIGLLLAEFAVGLWALNLLNDAGLGEGVRIAVGVALVLGLVVANYLMRRRFLPRR